MYLAWVLKFEIKGDRKYNRQPQVTPCLSSPPPTPKQLFCVKTFLVRMKQFGMGANTGIINSNAVTWGGGGMKNMVQVKPSMNYMQNFSVKNIISESNKTLIYKINQLVRKCHN